MSTLRSSTLAILCASSLLVAACGSSDADDDAQATTTTAAAATECPFDGSTAAKSLPTSGAGATSLKGTTGRRDGCVDQLRVEFSNGTPVVSAGYSDPAAPDHLVVVYGEARSASNAANVVTYEGPPTVAVPPGIAHVEGITVQTTPDLLVTQTFDMRSQTRFALSSSQVPPVVIISFG